VKSKAAFLLCLVLLLLVLLPHIPPGLDASPPEIGLGFGPSNVQPISEGVPIYTQGDNMWVESYYSSTIILELLHPNGATVTTAALAEPGELFELYTFKANDTSGVWTLNFATAYGAVSIPVVVASPNSSLVPVYRGVELAGSLLNQTFDLPPTDAYNIQVCSVGESVGSTFTFALAGGSNGSAEVSLSNDTTTISVSGISSQISTWFELYSEYSYSISGKGTVAQDLLVASTPVLSFAAPGSTQYSQLAEQMPLRQGRFDLRVFERTAAGLSLRDAPFLRTSYGTWISLQGCTSIENVNSPLFGLTTSLDSSNSSWPRHIITMYDLGGEESYSESPVPGAEAAIHLKTFPDGDALTGVGITASGIGLQASEWDAHASAVYLLTGGLTGEISIRLSYSGVVIQVLNVSIFGPYTSMSLSIPTGSLDASATLQGKALANATMSLAAPGSPSVVVTLGPSGALSILLPPNNYTLSASYEGTSQREVVAVTAGHITTASLDLTRATFPVLLYVLTAAGAAGLIVNIFVWRQYLERRKIFV
jgi:hypothetical protein